MLLRLEWNSVIPAGQGISRKGSVLGDVLEKVVGDPMTAKSGRDVREPQLAITADV